MTQETSALDLPESSLDPEDWDSFRALAHRMLDSALDHMAGARERPVWKPVPESTKEALRESLPLEGQGTAKVCQDFTDFVLFATAPPRSRARVWIRMRARMIF